MAPSAAGTLVSPDSGLEALQAAVMVCHPPGDQFPFTNRSELAKKDPGSHTEVEAVGAFASVESLNGQGLAVG